MICEFCKGQTIKKKVKKQHWFKGRLYIIENVEAETCRECGERYYHAKMLDSIDYLLQQDHEVKAHVDVEVVSM